MLKWSHGHSIATGGLIVLLAEKHEVWSFTMVFILGLLVGRMWRTILSLGNRVDELSVLRRRKETEDAR